MVRIKFLAIALLVSACCAFAQTPPIRFGTSAPASCTTTQGPGELQLFWDTANAVLKYCSATNTWSSFGSGTGTVNGGTQYQAAYYATSTTAVSGASSLTTGANGGWTIATPTGAAVGFTVTGDASSSHIANFNINGGSGGNGAYVTSAGALQVASSITTGGGTGAGAVGIYNADNSHFANLTADALNNLQINGVSPMIPWDKSGRVTVGFTVQCTGTAPTGIGIGTTSIGTSVINAAVVGTSSQLCLQSMQTKSSTPASGDAAGMAFSNLVFPFGHNATWTSYIKLDSEASGSIRFWAGMTTSFNTADASDTPNIALAAFRYSTGASDTNFMCVTQADNAHVTATSSGVAADALVHYLRISENTVTGHYLFYIDGVQKCDLSTAANLPASGTLMGAGSVVTTLTTAQRTNSVGYQWLQFDGY